MISRFPKEYIAYLKSGKPVEGELTIEPGYFQLWPYEDIDQLNEEYTVNAFAPSHKGFGSSGGGEMLAFNSKGQIVMIPFIWMSDDEAILIAASWSEFEKTII